MRQHRLLLDKFGLEPADPDFGAKERKNPQLRHHLHLMRYFTNDHCYHRAAEADSPADGGLLRRYLGRVLKPFPSSASLEEWDDMWIGLADDEIIDVEKFR